MEDTEKKRKNKYYIYSTFDLLPTEIKNEGTSIVQEHKNDNLELCQILNVDAEIYETVSASLLDLSAYVKTALIGTGVGYGHCKTIADVLHFTIPEIIGTRNLGVKGQAEVVVMTKKFIEEEKNYDINLSNIYDGQAIREKYLGYALNCLMRRKNYNNISYNDTECRYIEKYKEALEVLDKELCIAAFQGDKCIYDIIRALYIFSEPTIRFLDYVNEIAERIYKLPTVIKDKSVKLLLTIYNIKNEQKCEVLLGIKDNIKLIDFPKYITKLGFKDRNIKCSISDFIDWLNVDFDVLKAEISRPFNSMSDIEKTILHEKSKKQTYKTITEKYSLMEGRAKEIYYKTIENLRLFFKENRYDIFGIIFLYKGNYEIRYDDIKSFIGENIANDLWCLMNACPNFFDNICYFYHRQKQKIVFSYTLNNL